MPDSFTRRVAAELARIRADGLWKDERVLASPQRGRIDTAKGGSVLNFCANNYLGLADHPALVAAGKEALDRWGYGMASVRFICGTQEEHKALEARLAGFLGTEDAILYSSCFDANGGLFETLLGEEDAIISDALNHASIIDGVRLSKARRLPLRQQRHGRARALPHRGGRRAHAADRHRRRLLDGRGDRRPRRDLRPRGAARRAGDGRRQPRHRLRRRQRPRHPRALRRGGPGRHPHRHPRQGARRRGRRLRRRPARGRRPPAAAVAPLPLLEQPAAGDRRHDPPRRST